MLITEAIEKFESCNGHLNPLQYLMSAEKFAQDHWPHRSFDLTSENKENATMFVRAVLVRKCKNAGLDAVQKATKMQTELRKALNHQFGSYAALKLLEKLIFEFEMESK